MSAYQTRADKSLIEWGGVRRGLLTAMRFMFVHASMLMAALVICLFAMVLIWLVFDPPPLI